MIAFKTFRSATGSTTFDERHVGGSGGQADFGGYKLDATDATILVRLPAISQCEGRLLKFITVNPSARTIQIAIPVGSSNRIVINGSEVTNIVNVVDFGQVLLACDGFRWFALSDGTFA